jgi:hypothetical protein
VTCDHLVHYLAPAERAMLATAVTTIQGALWGTHPPTVFGNDPSALMIVRRLGEHFDGSTVHHAKDGCWHAHFPTQAFNWHSHLRTCPITKEST